MTKATYKRTHLTVGWLTDSEGRSCPSWQAAGGEGELTVGRHGFLKPLSPFTVATSSLFSSTV